MTTKKKGTAPTATTTSAVGTVAKNTGMAALRAVFGRRHVIVGCIAVAVSAVLFFFLIQLVPRTVKPTLYRVGESELPSLTQVVGHRKLLGMSESLSGLGRAESGRYAYRAGREPRQDVDSYLELLADEYGGTVAEGAQLGETDGKVTVLIPTQADDSSIELNISYSTEEYTVTVEEKRLPKQKPEKTEALVTSDEAKEILLTLTKAETGFKSDISVYTAKLEEDTVQVDGWDYYVFTIIADYSATRIEYRGTFYISCNDGAILRYDKDTDTTSRIER